MQYHPKIEAFYKFWLRVSNPYSRYRVNKLIWYYEYSWIAWLCKSVFIMWNTHWKKCHLTSVPNAWWTCIYSRHWVFIFRNTYNTNHVIKTDGDYDRWPIALPSFTFADQRAICVKCWCFLSNLVLIMANVTMKVKSYHIHFCRRAWYVTTIRQVWYL